MGALREVGWCLAAAKQVHGGYVAGARLLSILAMSPRHPRISHPPSRHPPTHSLATHPLATYPSANQQLAALATLATLATRPRAWPVGRWDREWTGAWLVGEWVVSTRVVSGWVANWPLTADKSRKEVYIIIPGHSSPSLPLPINLPVHGL